MIIAFTGAGISAPSGIMTFEQHPEYRNILDRNYATRNPDIYKQAIQEMEASIADKEPNDAHKALADFKIPIITMNVDDLHKAAGSQLIMKIHGELPDPVLYGDSASKYQDAIAVVDLLGPEDILMVIGVSGYCNISGTLISVAQQRGATVIQINKDAETDVRKYLNWNKDRVEDWYQFVESHSENPEWYDNIFSVSY